MPTLIKKTGNQLYDELQIVTYKFVNKVTDDLEGHHIPSKKFMQNLKNNARYLSDLAFKKEVDTYKEGMDALTFMLEKGRHTLTLTYRKNSSNPDYLKSSPLEALAMDIDNLRDIYRSQSLYTADVASKISQFESKIKTQYSNIFK